MSFVGTLSCRLKPILKSTGEEHITDPTMSLLANDPSASKWQCHWERPVLRTKFAIYILQFAKYILDQ